MTDQTFKVGDEVTVVTVGESSRPLTIEELGATGTGVEYAVLSDGQTYPLARLRKQR